MKYPIPKRAGWILTLTTVVSVMASMLAITPAEAALLPPPAPRVQVNVSDEYIKGQCSFRVSSVNSTNNSLTGPLTLKIAPAKLFLAGHIVQVRSTCILDHGLGPAFTKVLDHEGGPYGYARKNVTFSGRMDSLCLFISYTLRNGAVKTKNGCSVVV